jgi:hypothetical protein
MNYTRKIKNVFMSALVKILKVSKKRVVKHTTKQTPYDSPLVDDLPLTINREERLSQ